MWIAPFSTVGAYYRAHFTLDASKAITGENDQFTVKWEMPHTNMPKSIPMKVKLSQEFVEESFGQDACVVLEQDGKTIYPDENGVFILEFTSLKATIRKTAPKANMKPYSALSIKKTVGHAPRGYDSYTLLDAKGNHLGKTNGFQVPANMPKGIYFIRAEAPGYAPLMKKVIH